MSLAAAAASVRSTALQITATFAAARGPSYPLCSQRCCCIPVRPSVCGSLGVALLSSHTLSSSLGLMLGPVQHPRLQVVLGPTAAGGGSCLCQAAGLDSALTFFAWLWWLLVTSTGWPEEKGFGLSACHGAGFARAEGRAEPLCALGSLAVCGYDSMFVATCCSEPF